MNRLAGILCLLFATGMGAQTPQQEATLRTFIRAYLEREYSIHPK